MLNKYALNGTLLLSILSFSSPSFAQEQTQIANELKVLREQLQSQQAVIAQQQKAISSLEKKLTQVVPSDNTATSPQKTSKESGASPVNITFSPTPKFESADGKYSFQPLGRIDTDAAFFQDDKTDHPDGATFRRLRMGAKGTLEKDFNYVAELEFGNKDEDDSVTLKNVYLEYTGLDQAKLRAGNFKPALGLEEVASTNYLTFIEPSSPTSAFTTGEIIGAQAYNGGDHHSWAIGVHNDTSTAKSSDDEGKSAVARVTYAPIAEKDQSLHFGLAGAYRVPDSANDRVSYSAKAENSIQNRNSVATGNINRSENVLLAGLEAAGTHGPLTLQSEYYTTHVESAANRDPAFSGWYAQAAWLLTGETRPYVAKSGTYDRIKPNQPFSLSEGGWGAWEVAARYSTLDLNDAAVSGGELDDITLGLSWYLNPYVRLAGNYIIVNRDNVSVAGTSVAADDDPKIFLTRAHIDF